MTFIQFLAADDANNLLFGAKDHLKGISDNFNTSNYFSPAFSIGLLIVLAHALAIIFYIRWRRQIAVQPNTSALLTLTAQKLSISPKDSRVLARVSREVDFEPSAALISPVMLEVVLGRWTERFGEFSARDLAALDRVRRAIRTAIAA